MIRSIREDGAYYNPETVFNIKNSVEVSQRFDVKPCDESMDLRGYYTLNDPRGSQDVDNWCAYVFPHRCDLVWRIESDSFTLDKWRHCYLPEAERVITQTPSVQRTAWVKQASCVVEPCEAVGRLGWELREVNEIAAGRVDLENYFDENFNNKAVEDKGFGMETFQEKHNWWKHCQTYELDTKPYPMCHERYEWKSYITKQSNDASRWSTTWTRTR